MTKPEVIAKLTELKIPHDPAATKPVLEALLPPTPPTPPDEDAPAPEAGRAARWAAFLASAEKQNPVKFAAKKAKGEFDNIPDSFV